MRITKVQDPKKLNETDDLIIGDNMIFIFNDYRTSKTHKNQIFNIPINLENVINKYINAGDSAVGDVCSSLKDAKSNGRWEWIP